jgi:hypothetical protein
MMIAAKVVRLDVALAVGRAPEFAAPDDQRLIEQPALLEIGNERGAGLVGLLAFRAQTARKAAVMIPIAMAKLNEANAPLSESAREQAVVGITRFARRGPVEVEDFFRFLREIGQFRHAGLHAECEFVVFNLRGDRWVAQFAQCQAIEVVRGVEQLPARSAADAGGIGNEKDRITCVAKLHTAILRRQKATSPVSRLERLPATAARQHDEGRQITIVTAEPIGEPRAHGRTSRLLVPRGEKGDRGIVIDRIGVHRAHEGAVIDDLRQVRQQLGDVHARLPVLLKLEGRTDAKKILLPAGHRGNALPLAHAVRQVLSGHFGELRLRIEKIEMRWRTGHEEVNDPFRLGSEVQPPQSPRDLWTIARLERKEAWIEQRSQRQRPETGGALLQESASGEEALDLWREVHVYLAIRGNTSRRAFSLEASQKYPIPH